ncbi:hypothetical protein L6164_026774 [Bauhinia variegata]|uniref:Uncharacterized protein n=1 Tax=Bauhinia variegata TaxID=167791 RepID=A0ACB9LRD0_BAUVA|nr:hypothetical protein L6164_026774 [Bauhinia variegata]
MQSTRLISSPFLPFHQFSSSKTGSRCRKTTLPSRIMATRQEAADRDFGGRLVDESMIVLRKRIHEMKMMERNYEPPSDWMAWEKRYYTSYDSMICDAMGILQTQLMNTRPSLALGIIALVAMSVPTSAAVVLSHLLDMSKVVFLGINHLI